ncbi:hypothetical protein [Aureimonas sp. ME7]|uniref:hypothetical protein n=1 Tax=Aureimonas sp. ME7 TaxID=2744252 RepID=UPI0015F5FE8D|nr:hypothetical protein [Aureimonas sp. ME7]
MSRIPGASPITPDIEDIRRSDGDEDRSLAGDDAGSVPEPVPGESEREAPRDERD